MDERWRERCEAQHVHVLEGERLGGLCEYGFVLGRDNAGLYPLGEFEKHGDVAFFPAQTLNAVELERMLSAAVGLARTWDKTGFLTARFVKQIHGSDFALLCIDEETTRETNALLRLRGLEDWGASFGNDNNTAPVLTELTSAGVSAGEHLYTGETLRDALRQLPEETALPEWAVLRNER